MAKELLKHSTMPPLLEAPVRKSLSSEEINNVIGTLTIVLKPTNLEMSLHKPSTIDRFDTMENHLLNLKADYQNFKEWSTKKNEENRFLAKENTEIKQKIEELDASSK